MAMSTSSLAASAATVLDSRHRAVGSQSVLAPRVGRPARGVRRNRAQELIDAASTLFVEQGFAATRTEDIARRAGVAKGTLFLHFQNKERLFRAVVRNKLAPPLVSRPPGPSELAGPAVDRLQAVLRDIHLRHSSQSAVELLRLIWAESAAFPDLAQAYVDEVICGTRQRLFELLSDGVQTSQFDEMPVADVTRILLVLPLAVTLLASCPSAKAALGLGTNDAALLDLAGDLLLRSLVGQTAHGTRPMVPDRRPDGHRRDLKGPRS